MTDRQVRILRLLGDGLRTRAIAAKLLVSEQTVKGDVRAILAELGARNRAQAFAIAYRRGLVG